MVFRRQPDDMAREQMTAVDLAAEAAFDLGPLYVAPPSLTLTIPGATATIEPRIMQVLVMLARRPGEVISRAMFAESCWGGLHVSEDAIQRAIGRVRKLGEWSGAFAVETVPRVG
jgi:DNA-binding winged helix-turn-helix (wHTH) protein